MQVQPAAGLSKPRRYREWTGWIIIGAAVLFFFASLIFQACSFVNDNQNLKSAHPVSLSNNQAQLALAYPAVVKVDDLQAVGQPITVKLSATQVYTPPLTYTVSFENPANRLLFTDKEGTPVSSVDFVFDHAGPGPAWLYVHRSPLNLEGQPSTALTVTVISAQNNQWLKETLSPIKLELESTWQAFWRHFFTLLLGPPTVLVSTAIGLVVFVLQQQYQQQKQKTEETRRTIAFEDIETLRGLLASNPAEAANYYIECGRRQDYPWTLPEIKKALEHVWQSAAPLQLQELIPLVQAPLTEQIAVIKKKDTDYMVNVLGWGLAHLDTQAWQAKVNGLLSTLQTLPEYQYFINNVERREVNAIINIWPNLVLNTSNQVWRGDKDIEQGMKVLDLKINPFGPGQAEEDTFLWRCRVDLPAINQLRQAESTIVTGPAGSGKTAAALLLIEDNLRELKTFPVYWPLEEEKIVDLELASVVRVVARTLLSYLAIKPAAFLEHRIEEKAAIAHLTGRYVGVGPKLNLLFHQAGLSQFGNGQKMLAELNRLLKDVPFDDRLNDTDLLHLLAHSRPFGFARTMLFLDIQPTPKYIPPQSASRRDRLYNLAKLLEKREIFMTTLLPDTILSTEEKENLATIDHIVLEWTNDHLADLLTYRLKKGAEVDTLAAWFVPWQRDLDADRRLVERANGSPANLLISCNMLLKHIGQTKKLLTEQDFIEVLGNVGD